MFYYNHNKYFIIQLSVKWNTRYYFRFNSEYSGSIPDVPQYQTSYY